MKKKTNGLNKNKNMLTISSENAQPGPSQNPTAHQISIGDSCLRIEDEQFKELTNSEQIDETDGSLTLFHIEKNQFDGQNLLSTFVIPNSAGPHLRLIRKEL